MSFNLSAGTLDTMAGVFSPAKKYRTGTGGGTGKVPKSGGTILGLAVASMFPKAAATSNAYRPPAQTKRAFGGGNQAAVSGRAVATLQRTARRSPEVMVRITGRQHGGGHVLANFAYISRLGHGADKELGLITSEGEVIHDGREMQKLAQEWHEYEMGDEARRKGATSLSMILSMPMGTDPEKLKAAALDFAREEFANRSWVASLHVDRDHPHVHLTVARRDHDGRRFHPNRDDLFRYRQRFAQKLRGRGIDANATPAKARGIDPKHEHIAAKKVREKGSVPRLDKTRAARLNHLRAAGRANPVADLLSDRRATVRAAYERSIAELSRSPSLADKTVAQSLQRFIDRLPDPEPNSIRAAREREGGGRTGTPAQQEKAAAQPDALTASIARLKLAQDKSKASFDALARRGESAGEAGRARGSEGTEPPRTPADQIDRPSTTRSNDKLEEILRQVQDRGRAHRARDRDRDPPPDRGGPRR